MTPRTVLTGLGAFFAGAAALVAAAVVGEAYVGKLPERSKEEPEPAPAAPAEPALIEAPHVAEERDGPVDTAPGAPGVAAPAADAPANTSAEHVPTDLLADANPREGRAPDAFRPDPTAPVPPEMRNSLRPATGPAKAFAANEGETVTEALNPG